MMSSKNKSAGEMAAAQFLFTLSQDNIYKEAIQKYRKMYIIQHLKLDSIKPLQVQKYIENKRCLNSQKLNDQFVNCNTQSEGDWQAYECKIFSWISICFAFLNNKQLAEFNDDDLLCLKNLFPQKSLTFLRFQVLSLKKVGKERGQIWQEQQVKILSEIVEQQKGMPRWCQVSYQIYSRSSGRFLKSRQNCKQHWMNHLNPSVKKDKWTLIEDFQLFRLVSKHGKKWATISKVFNGTRTEHMVKNRFHSMLKRQLDQCDHLSEEKLIIKIRRYLQKRVNRINKTSNIKIQQIQQSRTQQNASMNCSELPQIKTQNITLETAINSQFVQEIGFQNGEEQFGFKKSGQYEYTEELGGLHIQFQQYEDSHLFHLHISQQEAQFIQAFLC